MVIQNYSVSLDSKVVKKALGYVKRYGGKLSPLINEMLIDWCLEQEQQETPTEEAV